MGLARAASDALGPIVRTVRVQNNVAAYTVARPADSAFPTRTVWRAQDGSLVRVVTQTF